MTEAATGSSISPRLLQNYFATLVNRFFKILPIRESEEVSLSVYLRSLQVELLGCRDFIPELEDNPSFLTLLSVLQFLYENPKCDVKEVKREVFRAINICNKLKLIVVEEALNE